MKTNVYILKLIYYAFYNVPQLNKYAYNNLSLFNIVEYKLPIFNYSFKFNSSPLSIFCMIILVIGSLFLGAPWGGLKGPPGDSKDPREHLANAGRPRRKDMFYKIFI